MTPEFQRACHVTEALGIDGGLWLEDDISAHADQRVGALLHFATAHMFDLCVSVASDHLRWFGEDETAAVEDSLAAASAELRYVADLIDRYGRCVEAVEEPGEPDALLEALIGGPIQECSAPECDLFTRPGFIYCENHGGKA